MEPATIIILIVAKFNTVKTLFSLDDSFTPNDRTAEIKKMY